MKSSGLALEVLPALAQNTAPSPAAPADDAQAPRRTLLQKLRYDVDSLANRDPWFIDKVLGVARRVMVPYHRAEVTGVERIPRGAALYVGNHNGGSMTIDSFVFGHAVYRRHGLEGLPYILTHDFALSLPGLHQVFVKMGAVRASPDNARRVFEAGHKVLVYPGGAEESMRPYRDRNRIRFFGHRGYIRTALRHDVPIVPVVGSGSHGTCIVLDDAKWITRLTGIDRWIRVKSWPVTISVPWGLTFFPPPLYVPLPAKIRMEVLEPIRFRRSGEGAARDPDFVERCAAEVEAKMQQALERLSRA